jgi:DNA-binding NarL/FixJ family response regulator
MPINYKILLVESNDNVMDMMERSIRACFPNVELASASTPDAAIELLQRNNYDIVVCDAFLGQDKRISFVADMCEKAPFFLIVITGDTGLSAESFSAHLKQCSIHHVLYKPLELKAFLQTLQCAILCVTEQNEEPIDMSREPR